MKKLLFLVMLLLGVAATAQNEYDAILRLRAMNESVRGIRSMADGEHYTTLTKGDIRRFSY
ncbi:MAG: hypothetical protein IIX12_04280, partial [Alistipes sp.]|nr:hypothetical protein [Alistipes sp.]